MKLICVTLFLIFNYVCGSGSILPSPSDPIVEEIQDKFFLDVEYPQSVQETSRVFFKPIGILDPFSEEVKSSYKSIAETNRNSNQEAKVSTSLEIELEDTKDNPQNFNVSSDETNDKEIANNSQEKSADTVDSVKSTTLNNDTVAVQSFYTESNITMQNENFTIDDDYYQKNLKNVTGESSSETDVISSDDDDTANIENETTAKEIKSESIPLEHHEASKAQEYEPVEAVLPKPPSADDDDNIAVVETEDEDSINAADCEETCVIEKTPVDD